MGGGGALRTGGDGWVSGHDWGVSGWWSEEDGLEEMLVGLMEKFAFSPTSYDMGFCRS